MKNDYEIRGDVTAIIINSPKYGRIETLISTNKLDKVKQFPNSWVVQRTNTTNNFYVVGSCGGRLYRKKYQLHRYVTDTEYEGGFDIDHINGNTLDNTSGNLRRASRKENSNNRTRLNSNNTSGVRGVAWIDKDQRWRVTVTIDDRQVIVGQYKDLERAKLISQQLLRSV